MSTPTADQILAVARPELPRQRRGAQLLLAQTALNGIDFVEFEIVAGPATSQLHVHFLLAAAGRRLRPGRRSRRRSRCTAARASSAIDGRVARRSRGDRARARRRRRPAGRLLAVPAGDRLDARRRTASGRYQFAGLDRLFSVAPINFRPGCPVDFDCAPGDDCPPDDAAEPALDYLARDYASFRQLLLDLVAQRNPTWIERSPADLGIALLELFAYEGDHLSYLQDAVANEAYLDTARQRESAKRHAKLVDYPMHDGRNAWTCVHLRGRAAPGTIPARAQLVTRISAPLRFDREPGVVAGAAADAAPGPSSTR